MISQRIRLISKKNTQAHRCDDVFSRKFSKRRYLMADVRARSLHYFSITLLAGACLHFAGCNSADSTQSKEPLPRPVTYMTLEQQMPKNSSMVTGTIDSWKSEQVGFQVAGRVIYSEEPGMNIQGRILDKAGEVIKQGTLLAELENDRYKIRYEEARARVQEAVASVEAIRADIETTIPSRLAEVQAEHDRARKEYRREQRLLKEGAGAKRAVETARAKFHEARARLDQVKGQRQEKQAQLASAEAKVTEFKEGARRAELDLRDTQLFVPYNGQVSKVHVIPGGYVEKGQPVVSVQMMDPVKVELAVSADLDSKIDFNDVMNVYVEGSDEPMFGTVWHKDTVADASTRTFMVTLLIRNREQQANMPKDADLKDALQVRSLWNIESRHDNGQAPYFTNVDTLHKDEEGHFVWKAEGLKVKDLEGEFNPVFKVKKVRVIPGDDYQRYVHIFTYRELKGLGDLNPATDLLAGKLPDHIKDGDTLVLTRKQWLMRPGQLVKVDLQRGPMPKGFYIPANAVLKNEDGHHVFVVKDQQAGRQSAQRVMVNPGPSLGTFQSVSPVQDGSLSDGTRIVVDGASYLHNDAPIAAINAGRVRP